MAAANLLLKAAICCVFSGWMSRTARRMMPRWCVACQPPRYETSSRGHPMIRLLRTCVCAADNNGCLLRRHESEAMMERLHSDPRQRSCIVLAEEDKRFIRQVPPLNGEVGRGMCCRAESTMSEATAEKAGARVGFKRDEASGIGRERNDKDKRHGFCQRDSVRPSLSGNRWVLIAG